jgi:NAD(P)-dependent dehydrogenase (short-subunit alcohol dehydrogenase family)
MEVNMRLQDQVAIITGSGSGIGKATALLFAREGAHIVVADRDTQRANETAAEIQELGRQALVVTVDVTDNSAIQQMVATTQERFGRIDILVNNAAYSQGDDILTIEEATWDLNLTVVLKSVFLCSKAVLPVMIAQRRGAIVNISSVNGLTAFGEEAYSAGKAGVINLTRNMACKYGQHHVRVNVICPGTIQTPLWQPRLAADPDIFTKLAEMYPLERVGQPEDVAKAILFLASDDASWITGITLNVDGGLTAYR